MAVVDTITGGAFVNLHLEHAYEILDQIIKTSRGWHTQEVDKSVDTYVIGSLSEQRALNEMVAQVVT